MEEIRGLKISQGIAIGTIGFWDKSKEKIVSCKIADSHREWQRFELAKKEAILQLKKTYEEAKATVGEYSAEIFLAHQMLLSDSSFCNSVSEWIYKEKVSAEYAVYETGEAVMNRLMDTKDLNTKEKIADIRDITERLLAILSGKDDESYRGNEPVILFAKELLPSEVLQLKKNKILALVTTCGSTNSHVAILAKSMEIPYLTNIVLHKEANGKNAVIDGYEGILVIEPAQQVLDTYMKRKQVEKEEQEALPALKENTSTLGKKIKLFANISNEDEVVRALEKGAEGIGLFRSEFLYLQSDHFPTEEEQFTVYKKVVETMAGKPVIIRTMDIGADKQVSYFDFGKEENPALGTRGIRLCLKRPDIFKTQLRALYRAACYGNLSVMYPMIVSVEEVLKIKELSRQVLKELEEEGAFIGKIQEGIMIETPAACLIADELALCVDFFSIGTNDLTQYTLAMDRGNKDLVCEGYHKAVIRLIQMVIESGHKAGIDVGICGELGADTAMTEQLIKLGIDEISVAPGSLLPIRKAIGEVAIRTKEEK